MPLSRIKARPAVLTIFSLFLLLGINLQSKAETTAELSDGKPLYLIGIGMYQELRNDIYIGALFAPQSVNDVEQLLGAQVAKRMSLRFVSEYSNRKLARHWKERMAMNNPREQWQPLTREIVGFSNLFKRTFVAGDEINIDFIPGTGVQVYLNKTLFKTFKKAEFMDVLLNVWLGNIPPTKAFKSSIRGLDNETTKNNYISSYSVINPVKGRFDADLLSPVQVAKEDDNASETAKPEENKQSLKVAKQESAAKKNEPKQENAAKQKLDQTNLAKKENTPDEVSKNPNIAQAVKKPDTKSVGDSGANKQKPPVAKKVAIVEPEPVEDLIDVDLISGSYTRDLINTIQEHQEYPRKAYIEKEEGDVTAKVTISANGDIVNAEIIEQSGSRILDKAVLKIIRKSAPFQAIPPELKLQEFVFEVPISFKL